MAKCNYDCFHCTYDDCIESKMSKTESQEISRRDKAYFNSTTRYIKQKPKLSRKRKALAWQ